MKITRVEVENFGCLLRGRVDLGPGLNILYGPNDLGKSTLTRAIRAALLLPHTSADGRGFAPWDSDEDPVVKVTLGLPSGRFWQVEKRFANPGASLLRESNDGLAFNSPFKKAREVDAELREKLAWGVASPATKRGRTRGLPVSFLSTVLLGEQANVTEVLRTTLDTDTDDSGRERLTAALSAFAQDPLFKRMLETAQSKVDEAFTATGKRKRGASSPFVSATNQVKAAKEALEKLQKSAEESDGAIRELAEKNQVLALRDEALTDAVAELESLEQLFAQQGERLAVESRLTAAQESLRLARVKMDEFKKRESDLVAIREQAQTLAEAKGACDVRKQEAQQGLAAAEDALKRAQSQEAEQARKLRVGELERQQLELESAAKSLTDERATMERARKLHGEMGQHEGAFEALAERELLASKISEESKLARAAAETALRDVELARRVRTVRDLEAELASLQEAHAEAEKRGAEVKVAREDETQARRRLRDDLPSLAEIAAIDTLITERDLAEARLGGGMAVSVELLKAVEVQGTVDGSSLAPIDGTVRFDAERGFDLTIGDVARVNVSAGSPEAREAVRQLQTRVESELNPALTRLGVEDFAGLRKLVEANDAQRRECERLAREVEKLEAVAAAQKSNPSKLESIPARLTSLQKDIAGESTGAAEALLEELGDASLEGREADLRSQAEDADRRHDEAMEVTRSVETDRQLLQQRSDATKASLDELGVQEPADGWEAAVARLHARCEDLAKKTRAAEAELSGLNSEQAAEVGALEASLSQATSLLAQAHQQLDETTKAIAEIEKQAATLQGEINVSRPEIERIDVGALQTQADEIQAMLAAMPQPERAVSVEDKRQAAERVESAKQEHAHARDDARKAEGRLQTVSGQVVVEETERAEEALARAEQTEREIELDFDGWNLLVEKLRTAENTEGQHLGEALSLPVSKRFAELTDNRYSKLEVLPTLGAEGIKVSGMLRDVGSLSVGTQEQLATLLRLTIAEQLGATLILDDHLTQTDPERIEWFRRVLRAHASEAQLIVMTCHPLDYLTKSEMPGEGEAIARSASGLVQAIDLTKCVKRSGANVAE